LKEILIPTYNKEAGNGISMEDNAQPSQKVLIILNPVAGFSNSAQLEQMCQREFSKAGYQVDFHRTKSDENLSAL